MDKFLKDAVLLCEFSGENVEVCRGLEENQDNREMEGIADAYRIYRDPKCTCGLIVYAKHNNRWVSNPDWSMRAVVQVLLKKACLRRGV